jgi:hypothetical protein
MLDASSQVGNLGGPSERLGPQPHASGLVHASADTDRRVGTIVIDCPAESSSHVGDVVVDELVRLVLFRTAEQFERRFGSIGEV